MLAFLKKHFEQLYNKKRLLPGHFFSFLFAGALAKIHLNSVDIETLMAFKSLLDRKWLPQSASRVHENNLNLYNDNTIKSDPIHSLEYVIKYWSFYNKGNWHGRERCS